METPGIYGVPIWDTGTDEEKAEELDALLELSGWAARWEGHERMGALAGAVRKAAGLYTAAVGWARWHQPSEDERAGYLDRLRRIREAA